MNLSQAIENYVAYKQSVGIFFKNGRVFLKSFCHYVGDIPLEQITTEHVEEYLDLSKGIFTTWRKNYGTLDNFFKFFSFRGFMPFLLMPPLRPAERSTFIPYIYTKLQIRSLLAATKKSQRHRNCKSDASALRLFILMLYATGALYREIVTLRWENISFKRSQITLVGIRHNPPRCIPIGHDLKRELQLYRQSRGPRSRCKGPLFDSCTGAVLDQRNLFSGFLRAREIAGVKCEYDPRYRPRLYDLRFTFAVHRITSWIKSGADLNRLLPALSTYMGNSSLARANEYLALTPERFRKELQKLSPKRGRKRWRDDRELMKFLGSL